MFRKYLENIKLIPKSVEGMIYNRQGKLAFIT